MVISNIIGGLGNQMFQYVAGRALSLERNQSLRLDIAGFAGYGLHQGFELERVFLCPAEIATHAEVRSVLGWQLLSGIKRILARPCMVAFRRVGFVVEPHFYYWPGINHVPRNCYLVGYWQSERYFKSFECTIRRDFTFREPLSGRNSELALEIANTHAVSLHVRRGDYVSDFKTGNIMDVCSLEYYRKAISYVAERVEHPVFYVFSDDMVWVRQNLYVEFPCIYVDYNRGAASYRDMQLMSLCKHHIIANSSFSWWGAWLNSNPEKIVIAPRNWFRNGNDDCDLIPNKWVRL